MSTKKTSKATKPRNAHKTAPCGKPKASTARAFVIQDQYQRLTIKIESSDGAVLTNQKVADMFFETAEQLLKHPNEHRIPSGGNQ